MNLDNLQNFIRPIRKIIFLKNDEVVPFKLFNIESGTETFIHHFREKVSINSIEEYFTVLEKKGIVIKEENRIEIIKKGLNVLSKEKISSNISDFQLKFLSYFSESPLMITGSYDKRFLTLPVEILDLTLWKHQKCVLLLKGNKPINKYLTVCDNYTNEKRVISDYDKVILSRFDDAEFFYKNDLNTSIDEMYKKMKDTIYFENWGTYEKFSKYSKYLADMLGEKMGLDTKRTGEIIKYAKCDLASEVINEKTYTSLQGIMGYYYLLNAGFPEEEAIAIKEQYLPKNENGKLPETNYGALLSLIDRIMLLSVVFSLHLKVSGSKDIYGVRRAALALYKLFKKFNFNFDIINIFERIDFLSKIEIDELYKFIVERIKAFEKNDLNGEIIEAALYYDEGNLSVLNKKLYALWDFSRSKDFNDIKTTLKRVLNILEGKTFQFDPGKLIELDEKNLYAGFLEFQTDLEKADADFLVIFNLLNKLKPLIDKFFDNVMVNVEDKAIRENRKGLLTMLGNEILKIANFKYIS